MPKVNNIQYDVTLFASIKVVTPTIPNMVFTYRLFLNNNIQYDVTLFASIKVVTPTIPNMVFTYRLFLNQVLEIDRIIVFIHYFERVHVNLKQKHTNRKYKKHCIYNTVISINEK